MFLIFVDFWWQFLLLAVACYLFGSINYSVIFSRLIKKDDVRKYGSGNAGTTNMFRVYGLLMGLCTFVFDALKGIISCLVAKAIFANFCPDNGIFAAYFAGLFAVIGHVCPIFFKMRGGKGFATTVGIGIIMQPLLILCLLLPIFAIIAIFDRMSVAALSFSTLFAAAHWLFFLGTVGVECCIFASILFLIVVVAHRSNIHRLLTGKEPQTGVRKLFSKQKSR